ncbi:Lysoplasmalogenase [Papilio xuthus]|uniref:Lysoplasmalogenase TMEM86B n=1 Tax=Papilio xuthus TaxID=66420 RepID=A0A194PZY9_PAPXU|nr:Lysoplasmalogenase [Papilio xuthus]
MKRAGVSGQLVPFFKAVCVYFLLGAGAPSATTAALKCAPVICLFGCVLYKAAYSAGARAAHRSATVLSACTVCSKHECVHSMFVCTTCCMFNAALYVSKTTIRLQRSLNPRTGTTKKRNISFSYSVSLQASKYTLGAPLYNVSSAIWCCGRGRYARFVCLGLALSALGDAALVWPRLLAVGIVMFGAAHVAYIAAFGLRPRRAGLGALAALAAALYVRTLRPAALGPFAILVHVYAALLAAMAWRGAARPGPQRAGAVLFAISDALLGYSLFGGSLPYKNVLVMSTYYLGQLLIALSALKPAEAQQHEQ